MSSLRHLLDTNVAIGYLDGSTSARNLVDQYGANTANSAVSQITRIELLSYSALSSEEEGRIQALLAAVPVILLDDRIERETIALRRRIRMKLPDAVIAATARVHGPRTWIEAAHARRASRSGIQWRLMRAFETAVPKAGVGHL